MAESETALIDQYFGTSPPLVSKRLYEKAIAHNDELTQAERWLFLCQGILQGQILADPKSLTEEQMSRVLCRPSLEMLARNIKTTIGLDSVAEVLRDYWNPDRTKQLSYHAHECLTMGWWTFHTADIYELPDPKDSNPAVANAANRLARRASKEKAEEEALQWTVTQRFCSGMEISETDIEIDIEKEQKAGKSNEEWWMISHEWRDKNAAMDRALREKLLAQVNQKLLNAMAADLAAIRKLRERMISEVAEEAGQEAAAAKAKKEEEERDQKREKEEKV